MNNEQNQNTIVWETLRVIRAMRPNDAHRFETIDGEGWVATHEGFEAFIYPTIVGDYQYRGGFKSHLNLTRQEGGFDSVEAAAADAEDWLRKKAAAALKRRVLRAAKLGAA